MGCFNAACSVSNISIGAGRDVVFIPLIPPRYGRERYNHMLIYPNDLYNPFCLPIRGEYNDYGGLEEIIRDDNVEVVEKFLGITVEELIECISRKGVYDQFSMMSQKFLNIFELLKKYDTPIDEPLLNKIGFIKLAVDENEVVTYEYSDIILPYFLTISSKEISIIDIDGTIKYSIKFDEHHHLNMYLFDGVLDSFAKISNYYVGVPKDKQDIVKLIYSMSGMFVAGEIYDALIEQKYFDHYGPSYEEVIDKFIIKYKEEPEETYFIDYELLDYHRNWTYFKELYKEPLIEGKLKDALIAYNTFANNMYSMNRFFFPGMNGEQHGNHKASLALAEKTVEILKARIKEYEEDVFDDEELDE